MLGFFKKNEPKEYSKEEKLKIGKDVLDVGIRNNNLEAFKRGHKILLDICRDYPEYPAPYIELIPVFIMMKEYDVAKGLCEMAISRCADDGNVHEVVANGYLKIGEAYWEADRAQDAIDAMWQCIDIGGYRSDAFAVIKVISSDTGNMDEFRSDCADRDISEEVVSS